MRIRICILTLAVALAALLASGCRDNARLERTDKPKKPAAAKEKTTLRQQIEEMQGKRAAIEAPVTPLAPTMIREELEITGELTPVQALIVRPLMSGRIIFQRQLKVGDLVKKDELLAKIDDRDIEDEIVNQQQQIKLSDESIKLSGEELEQQKRQTEFDRKLLEEGFLEKIELEKSELQLRKAENSLRRSKISLVQEKNKLKQLLRKREKVAVTAPLSGMVVLAGHLKNQSGSTGLLDEEIMSVDGKDVGTGTELFGIVSQKGFLARCLVNGKDKARMKVGQRARTIIYSHKPIAVAGTVLRIAQLQDVKTHAYKVWIKLDKHDLSFTSGLVVRSKIELACHEQALVVDKKYVKERDGKNFVQLVADGVVRDAWVELGLKQGNLVELLSGVKEGDQLLVSEDTLAENQKVNAVQIEPESKT
ncbi:efflux RND transporter periplasmic adaptor subunit [Candidatus Sumerlaeota bacterium]